MTPGAVACILYTRLRTIDPTFQIDSQESDTPGCYIVSADWRTGYGTQRTYSSILAVGIPDVVKLLRHALATRTQPSRGWS